MNTYDTYDEGIGAWPRRRARKTPDRVAVVSQGREISYRELNARVARLAWVLYHRFGVRRGHRVAYLGPNAPSFLETLFAVSSLGAVFVPLNTRLAGSEYAFILGDCDPTVLLVDDTFDAAVRWATDNEIVMLRLGHVYDDAIASAGDSPVGVSVSLADPCIIMYTSGTTGSPKGAVLTHGNLTWNAYNVLIDIDIAADEVTLVTAPMFHVAALNMTCLPTLLKGGRVVLETKFEPERVLDLVEQLGVTFLFGVPAMYSAIASSPQWSETDLSSVRTLLCGGAPVPIGLTETYLARGLTFIQGYGMTEATAGVLCLDRDQSRHKAGSAGVPHFFTDVRLVGPDGQPVEVGNPGEVHVAGPNVSTGYWRRPDEAQTTFAGGWLRTGDIAVLDKDGYAYIIDRVKDMYISGGENVYPAEVEQLLHGHPAVADCAVIGVPDEKWGEVGKALIVPAADAESDPREVMDFLASRLAKYKVPRSVEFVDALPRNASGKILKSQLRAGLDRGPVRRADQGTAQSLDTGAP